MSRPKYFGNCPHCNATPPAHEIDEGWCDTCGKRLPTGFAPWLERAAPEAPSAAGPPVGAAWPVWSAGAAAVGALVALAAAVRPW